MEEREVTLEDFARYFPSTPAALCIKECSRLSTLRREALRGPLLDVGCGDGVFAKLAFRGKETWGVDINPHETKLAEASGAYHRVITTDITSSDLPESYFETCVANCSLEHVPRLDLALGAIRRALRPGGMFITYVPNRDWAEALLSYRFLSLGSAGIARRFQRFIDDFFKHEHLYDREGWHRLIASHGFEVLKVEPVLSSATTVAFEMFLLPSFWGFVNKKITHRWTNFPTLRGYLTRPVYRLVETVLTVGPQEKTAEFLVIARRP